MRTKFWSLAFQIPGSVRSRIVRYTAMPLVATMLLQSLSAQQPATPGTGAPKPEEKSTPAEKPKTEEAKKPSEVIAIVGGDIITVTRETIRKGTILVENGKIKNVGKDIEIPADAKKIDASGRVITPGFVCINMSGVGTSSSAGFGPSPSGGSGKLADELNPFDRKIQVSLAIGITSGCVQIRSGGGGRFGRAENEGFDFTERFPEFDPDDATLAYFDAPEERDYGVIQRLCACCNLPILPTEPITSPPPSPILPQKSSVVKMSYGVLKGMFVKDSAFLELTPGALTGASNQAAWRDQIGKAKKYLKDQAAHEQATKEGKREQPPRKPVSDEILSLVKREVALRITANRVSEIRDQLDLAKELSYRLVIAGGLEAWVIPKEIAAAGASLTITPRNRREARFGEEETSGSWIELPRVLEQSGIPFAVETLEDAVSAVGLAGRDLTSLPLEAAFAVRGGASEGRALAAITIVPATMLGLQDRIGSIEVGKDADLLILNGPPLDYRTYVESAMVNGKVVFTRPEDKVLPVYDRAQN